MTDRKVAQAEQDADIARARLETTLDELRTRIKPGRILDEALDLARDGSVGQFFQNFGGQVKRNPVPVVLVGTGLAWLMLGRGGSRAYPATNLETRYRATGDDYSALDAATTRAARYDRGLKDGETLTDKVSQGASQAADAVSAAYDSAASTYESAAGAASDMARDAGQGAGDIAGSVSDMGRRTARSVSRLVEEQPLVLGVLGLAIGAVIASAFPATQTENRIVGKTSDDLKRQASEEVNAQVDKAMTVAERAYDGAVKEGKQAAREEGWTDSAAKPDEIAKRNAPDIQAAGS